MGSGLGDVGRDSIENADTTEESDSSTSGDEDQLANEERNHAPKRPVSSPNKEIPSPSKKLRHSASGDREQPVDPQEESNPTPEHPSHSSNVASPDLMSASGGSGGPSVVEGPNRPLVDGPGHASPERPNPNQVLDAHNERDELYNEIFNVINERQNDGGADNDIEDFIEPRNFLIPPLPKENGDAAEPNAFVVVNGFIYPIVGPLPQEIGDAAEPNAFVVVNGFIYPIVVPLPQENGDAAELNAFVVVNGFIYQIVGPLPQENGDNPAPNVLVEDDLQDSSSSDSGFEDNSEDPEQEIYNLFE